MLRIVDGMVYEGKPSSDRWMVTLADLGSGHREAVIQRAIDWEESGPLDPDSIAAQVLRGEREDPNQAEKDEANRARSARRAKTRVRRLCKAQGCDTLLTLTYRENQTDLERAKRDFQAFVDRMQWALTAEGRRTATNCRFQFVYVAAFEQQKRGAWHVHLATHALPRTLLARNGVKVKSYNVVRAIWRSVAGEAGGNIDQSRRKRSTKRSPAKVAAYLSKYIMKAFEAGADHAKRYLASRCEIPERVRIQFVSASLADLIATCVADFVADGRVVCSSWVSRFGDTVYLAGELDTGCRSIHCQQSDH